MLRKRCGDLTRWLRSLSRRLWRQEDRSWAQDLCLYFNVTPGQAEALGKRSSGRRPDLPGSMTTHPVSGVTFEEIWDSSPRHTVQQIFQFWEDMGAWATFRQVYYHRHSNFSRIAKVLPQGGSLCEYGSGVAPICNWIVEHLRLQARLTIADVPSEHLRFGAWRLQRKIKERNLSMELILREVVPDRLPLDEIYNVITILEVFEHLHDPLEVAIHLTDHLRSGGHLWENYAIVQPSYADLPQSQEQREAVFAHLQKSCKPVAGPDPDRVPGGLRHWIKI